MSSDVDDLDEASNEDREALEEESFSMFNIAWSRLTSRQNCSAGPLVHRWFKEAFSAGCGGGFALHFLFDVAPLLVGKTDAQQREILIRNAISDQSFIDNVSDVADLWAKEV